MRRRCPVLRVSLFLALSPSSPFFRVIGFGGVFLHRLFVVTHSYSVDLFSVFFPNLAYFAEPREGFFRPSFSYSPSPFC